MFAFQFSWAMMSRLFCESGFNDRGDLRLKRGLVKGHFSAQERPHIFDEKFELFGDYFVKAAAAVLATSRSCSTEPPDT